MFYAKEIGTRICSLRKNINGKESISMKKFIEKLNSEDIYFDTYFYSETDIKISYGKSVVSKIENGEMLPSTDYLYLVHKRFNKSLDYLVFGHTLSEIEEFQMIYKRMYEEVQESFVYECVDMAEEKFQRDYDCDDIFVDYRIRLNEVRKQICKQKRITQLEFCKLMGLSKNTMEKYHSTKNERYTEKYVEYRNTALYYLIPFCSSTGVSLDYLLEGTYFDELYPAELSEALRYYNYDNQLCILKMWLKEAKNKIKNSEK